MKTFFMMLVGFMTAIAINSNIIAAGPPSALRAFTSTDPIVLQARELLPSGKFKEAEALLATNAPQASPSALADRAETLDLLRRIRYEYSLTPPELLAKMQTSI